MLISFSHTHLSGEVSLPASKSISNRLLVLHFLHGGKLPSQPLSDAHDTRLLQQLLLQMTPSTSEVILDVQDAGTVLRFLTAVAASREGQTYILRGTARLHERPVKDLVDALRQLGANIQYEDQEGFPPLRIAGQQLRGGRVEVSANISSQFISALCLIAPGLDEGLRIQLLGQVVSSPYIDMTLGVLKQAGVASCRQGQTILIPSQSLRLSALDVESDWSSASFFYAMAMLNPDTNILLRNLSSDSLQGDAEVRNWAQHFGITSTEEKDGLRICRKTSVPETTVLHFDASAYPDMAIPIMVACAIHYPSCTFSGLHHLDYKESRRLSALQAELDRVGISLLYENDLLQFKHREHALEQKEISFTTYHDHRIAMALSLLSLTGCQVHLDDGVCVQKSFPSYWQELTKLGFNVLVDH